MGKGHLQCPTSKSASNREKNLPPEKWMVSGLNTMMQWYKRPEDGAMLSKKADKLTRYHEIKGRGDPPMPQPIQMTIAPLPPLVGSKLEPIIPEEVDDACEQDDEDAAKVLLLFAMEV